MYNMSIVYVAYLFRSGQIICIRKIPNWNTYTYISEMLKKVWVITDEFGDANGTG